LTTSSSCLTLSQSPTLTRQHHPLKRKLHQPYYSISLPHLPPAPEEVVHPDKDELGHRAMKDDVEHSGNHMRDVKLGDLALYDCDGEE